MRLLEATADSQLLGSPPGSHVLPAVEVGRREMTVNIDDLVRAVLDVANGYPERLQMHGIEVEIIHATVVLVLVTAASIVRVNDDAGRIVAVA